MDILKKYWKKILISALFVAMAATMNAGMDELDHHFEQSFASEWNQQFWNPAISWQNKYINHDVNQGRIKWNLLLFEVNKPVVFTDGWHLLKMFMIIFIVLSIAIWIKGKLYLKLIYFLLLGVVWNISFETFYSKILRKKKK